MLEGFDAALLAKVSAPSLVALVVLMILLGRLIPSRTLDREIEAERRRADDYKAAWEASDARGDAQAEQIAELVELARTTSALVQALYQTAERNRSADDRWGGAA